MPGGSGRLLKDRDDARRIGEDAKRIGEYHL